MKRRQCPVSLCDTARGSRRSIFVARRGTLFHVTIIYMTLASALLTVAGLLLHSVLKSDNADRRESLFLNSLLRAEQQLRLDSGDAGVAFESESKITIASADQGLISWTADRGFLNRLETRGGETVGIERFVFPAGSQLLFHRTAPEVIALRIREPSPFVRYPTSANGGSVLNRPASESNPPAPPHVAQPGPVEIHLRGAR